MAGVLPSTVSPLAALAALPIAAFEFSLGIWLVVKGFKPTPLTSTVTPSAWPHDAIPVA